MTKQLLTEFFELCPDGRCLDMLSERQKREVIEEGVIYLTGRIQTAEKKNGNGRVYPRKVLEKEITNFISTAIEWVPLNKVKPTKEKKEDLINFFMSLQEDDDVQNVYSNVEFNN